MEKYLSVTEFSKLHHKDPGNVRRMLAAGRLTGQKAGNQWIIPENACYPDDMRERTGYYRNWKKRLQLNKNKELMKTIRDMIKDLHSIYEDSILEIILYGSYARGDQSKESDVDLALILTGEISKRATSGMIDCVAAHELECGRTLSVIEVDAEKYNKWINAMPFYRNIRKEGIVLWNRQV